MLGVVDAIGKFLRSGTPLFSPMTLKRFTATGLFLTEGNCEWLASGDILVSSQNMSSAIRDGRDHAFSIAKIAPIDSIDRQNRELGGKVGQYGRRKIHRRQLRIDRLEDFILGRAAEERLDAREHFVQFG